MASTAPSSATPFFESLHLGSTEERKFLFRMNEWETQRDVSDGDVESKTSISSISNLDPNPDPFPVSLSPVVRPCPMSHGRPCPPLTD